MEESGSSINSISSLFKSGPLFRMIMERRRSGLPPAAPPPPPLPTVREAHDDDENDDMDDVVDDPMARRSSDDASSSPRNEPGGGAVVDLEAAAAAAVAPPAAAAPPEEPVQRRPPARTPPPHRPLRRPTRKIQEGKCGSERRSDGQTTATSRSSFVGPPPPQKMTPGAMLTGVAVMGYQSNHQAAIRKVSETSSIITAGVSSKEELLRMEEDNNDCGGEGNRNATETRISHQNHSNDDNDDDVDSSDDDGDPASQTLPLEIGTTTTTTSTTAPSQAAAASVDDDDNMEMSDGEIVSEDVDSPKADRVDDHPDIHPLENLKPSALRMESSLAEPSSSSSSRAPSEERPSIIEEGEEGEIAAETPPPTPLPTYRGSGDDGSRCCWVCQVDLKFADPNLVCWYATHPHPYLPGVPVCVVCSRETATPDVCAACFGHKHHHRPDDDEDVNGDDDNTNPTTTLVLCDSCPNEYCVECLKVRGSLFFVG
jgi:hypothetical protein